MENLIAEYLSHLRVERRSSPRTVSACELDLADYAVFLGERRADEAGDVPQRRRDRRLRVLARRPRLRAVFRGAPRVGGQGVPPLPRAGGLRRPEPHRRARAAGRCPRPCPTCFPTRPDGRPAVSASRPHAPCDCATRPSWKSCPAAACVRARRWGFDLGDVLLDERYLRRRGQGEPGAPSRPSPAPAALGAGGLSGPRARRPAEASAKPTAAVFLNARGGRLAPEPACRRGTRRARHRPVQNLHPHTLRHSFATHMLEEGPTCASSRRSWGMPTYPPRRYTRT